MQNDRLRPPVCQADAAGNHIVFRQHTIKKHRFQAGGFILQAYLQSLRLFLLCIHSGKAGKPVFPVINLVASVAQIAAQSPVRILHGQTYAAEISGSLAWIFLGKGIQGIRPIRPRVIKISGKSTVLKCQQIVHGAVYTAPVV